MFLHSVFKIILNHVNIVHIIWHYLLLHYSALTCTICMYILYRSWGWMCITSETCRANSVIKITLNNLHQAGPNKTHIWWCMETQKSKTYCVYTVLRHSWWWTVDWSETCRVLYHINLRNVASRWLLWWEYITMHGPLNVKYNLFRPQLSHVTVRR